MRYQRQSEAPRKFNEEYEEEIQRLLAKTNTPYMRYPVYCYNCKKVFKNPYGNKQAPDVCQNCGVQFSEEVKCALPDFAVISDKIAFIFVHGSIHFKNEKRLMHDYHQYVELLENGYKCFVILNETLDRMLWSVRLAWLAAIKEAVRSDDAYLQLYENEQELGYLRRAVLKVFATVIPLQQG